MNKRELVYGGIASIFTVLIPTPTQIFDDVPLNEMESNGDDVTSTAVERLRNSAKKNHFV